MVDRCICRDRSGASALCGRCPAGAGSTCFANGRRAAVLQNAKRKLGCGPGAERPSPCRTDRGKAAGRARLRALGNCSPCEASRSAGRHPHKRTDAIGGPPKRRQRRRDPCHQHRAARRFTHGTSHRPSCFCRCASSDLRRRTSPLFICIGRSYRPTRLEAGCTSFGS